MIEIDVRKSQLAAKIPDVAKFDAPVIPLTLRGQAEILVVLRLPTV